MSVFNVDKPPISLENIITRLNYFNDQDHPVLITKTPMFTQKLSHLYLENMDTINNFILGYDTFERLFNMKYYSESNSIAAFLDQLQKNNVNFYVAGRLNQKTGIFDNLYSPDNSCSSQEKNQYGVSKMLLKNLNVPMEIWDTIHPINKSDGECVRVDISSTEIRQGLNN